jgi:choline dehydrogenase-like flavoprotein
MQEFQGEGLELEIGVAPPASGRAPRLSAVDVLVPSPARGRVLHLPGRRSVVLYQVRRDEVRRLVWGLATAAEILFAAGAEHVHLPVSSGNRTLHRPDDIDRFVRSRGLRATRIRMSGRDGAGTCPPGLDPREAVVRPDRELQVLDRLFVADASLVPAGRVGPVHAAVLALAGRMVQPILARLQTSRWP